LADELDLRGPLACACTEDEEKLKKLTWDKLRMGAVAIT
jgi:hypothetical protein